MPADLSVVIPTLNAARDLPPTLDALLEGVGSGVIAEVVFTDGGSTDATAEIAAATGAIWIEGPRGRGAQIARGVAATRRGWILILHADTHLPSGWSDAVRRHMQALPDQALAFRLAFRSTHPMARMTAAWANLRCRALDLPYGDQALLIARKTLEAAGGMPEISLMEDVELARRLKGRIHLSDLTVTTSADRYATDGWLRRGARNLILLARYLCGADPEALARAYRRPPRD